MPRPLMQKEISDIRRIKGITVDGFEPDCEGRLLMGESFTKTGFRRVLGGFLLPSFPFSPPGRVLSECHGSQRAELRRKFVNGDKKRRPEGIYPHGLRDKHGKNRQKIDFLGGTREIPDRGNHEGIHDHGEKPAQKHPERLVF